MVARLAEQHAMGGARGVARSARGLKEQRRKDISRLLVRGLCKSIFFYFSFSSINVQS